MSYTFSYNPVTKVASAIGNYSQDSLAIAPVNGYLEHSVNGSPFSGSWGFFSVQASPKVTVDITVSGKDKSSVTLGVPNYPASNLYAQFNVDAPPNTSDTTSIDDSTGTTLAVGPHAYNIDTITGTVTGPGINYNQGGGNAFEVGLPSRVAGGRRHLQRVLGVQLRAIHDRHRRDPETVSSTSARMAPSRVLTPRSPSIPPATRPRSTSMTRKTRPTTRPRST